MPTRPFSPVPPCRQLAARLLARYAGWAVAAVVLAPVAMGQEADDAGVALDPQVNAAVTAPYLSPVEAAALRLAHGVPTAEDLRAPATRASHALDRGAYTDAALSNPAADPLDRAEAALARGDFAAAEPLMADGTSVRALRLRAQSQLLRADNTACIRTCRAAVARLTEGRLKTGDEVAEAVRCAAMLARLTDVSASGGGDYQAMMAFLARARETDPFSWRVRLAEAQLLLDKDNWPEARGAAVEALKRNPACAEAYAVLGEIAVSSFDLEAARVIADRLDALAAMGPLEGDDSLLPSSNGQPSPQAAFIRVRAALRQNEADEARDELNYAARRLPVAPVVLELACAVAAASYDERALGAALAAFKERLGDNPAAEARVGMTFSDLRQYGEAVEHLRRAAAQAPFWAGPRVDLGLVLVQAARDDEAAKELDAATRLDPFNVRAANSLKLVREVAGYARVETEHFVVRARPGLDALLAREIALVMEENHAAVTGDRPGSLDYQPPGKTFIDLMPDHAWFAVRITGLSKVHTIAASTGPVIAMEAPRQGKGHTGVYDWPRVLRHEYTHTVGLSRTSNRLPHWFTEAQAQYLERVPRDYNTAKLLSEAFQSDGLFDFSTINVAFTRPKKPTDRSLAYAQGQWMYEYMVERFGPQAPLALMDLFAKGVREEAAVQQSFRISRERFLADFKGRAKEQLVSWGMLNREGEVTLESLVKELPRAEGSDEPPTPTREQLAVWDKEHPGNPDVLRLIAQAAVDEKNGALDEGDIDVLRRYAKARSVDPFPHQQLARFYLAQQDQGPAVPELEWLDARTDRTALYATQLAGLYAKAGEWDKAAAKAERAARITPYDARARELGATIAVQRKDYGTARRHLEFLAALEPDRAVHRQRLEALSRLESQTAP